MGFGFRVGVPGMSVRVSTRGVRTSIVPRAARVSVGSGGARLSSGLGPFCASSSLSGGRGRTSTRRSPRSRTVAPSAAQLERAGGAGAAGSRTRCRDHSTARAAPPDNKGPTPRTNPTPASPPRRPLRHPVRGPRPCSTDWCSEPARTPVRSGAGLVAVAGLVAARQNTPVNETKTPGSTPERLVLNLKSAGQAAVAGRPAAAPGTESYGPVPGQGGS